MDKLSRRSFVKQLAGVSMLGAAAPVLSSLVGCGGNRITLNVVLHGLFIMNITDSQIELFTPKVDKHYYGAGNWDAGAICSLDKGDPYQLHGVDKFTNMPPLGPDANLTLSQSKYKFSIHAENSLFKIELPFPQRVAFLRRVIDGNNEPPVGGAPAVIRTFALCPVLVYPVNDYRDLELTRTKWKPKVEETRTANLHLWAEPTKKLSPAHADDAFNLLSTLVTPVCVKLATTKSVALDHDPGIKGVSTEEEQGLSEWISGGETSHPTNCNVVITTQ
jgi:hypothetical protein